MIKGIGIDLIEGRRFRNLKNRREFLKQFTTNKELLAVRRKSWASEIFATKEAIFKALRCGLYFGWHWHDIELKKNLDLRLSGFIRKCCQEKKISKIHISHARTKVFVTTFVVLEENGKEVR